MALCLVTVCIFILLTQQQFAGDGLRTLVAAYKDVDKEYFQEWFQVYQKANAAQDSRDEQIALAYEEMEQDLKVFCKAE